MHINYVRERQRVIISLGMHATRPCCNVSCYCTCNSSPYYYLLYLKGEGCGVIKDSLTHESDGSEKGSPSSQEPTLSASSEVVDPIPELSILLYMSLISSSLVSNFSRLQNVTILCCVLLTLTWTSRPPESLMSSSRLNVWT